MSFINSEYSKFIAIAVVIVSISLILYYTMKKETMEDVAAPVEMEILEEETPALEIQELSEAPKGDSSEIKPEDLLPTSAATEFEQEFPTGQGDEKDKNFLIAGFNIGINTVGSSLKNANLQLRSDPYIPRKSTLWNDSSIMSSDLTNRQVLEIGSTSK